MEKKNKLIKNIFFTFFAFCFMCAGALTLGLKQNENVYAQNIANNEVVNTALPSYFSASQFNVVSGTVDEQSKTDLLDTDTFLYFTEGETSNKIDISLLCNGSTVNTERTSDQYNYVYYPDPTNLSTFYFYDIYAVNLYINGQLQEGLVDGDYIEPSGLSFTNKDQVSLETFRMTFSNQPTDENNISILNGNGDIVEGVYTLSLKLIQYTCNAGKTDGSEEPTSFSDETIEINYSFYVLDRSSYLFNNKPVVEFGNFDSSTTLVNAQYAQYLYSNYSSKGTAYEIPYFEYDYTRFEATIQRYLAGETYTQTLNLNTDSLVAGSQEETLITSGDSVLNENAVVLDKVSNKNKVYLTDVGEYAISLKAIKLIPDQAGNIYTKYTLPAVTNTYKSFKADLFGYQANYTDLDSPTNANNIRPIEELKDYDFESGLFSTGADITSGFLNSNASYSQETASETFLIANILKYIKDAEIAPVQTNQTPIAFTANATLCTPTMAKSYIFSTTEVSTAYQEVGTITTPDGNEKLYRTTFSGSTESSTGKYIYLIAYNYKNYYSGATLMANQVFYQVFYFEIIKELPNIAIYTDTKTTVPCDSFVNEAVYIEDTTKSPFNKEVVVRIFAKDFTTKTYKSDFGNERGISLDDYAQAMGFADNTITLNQDAKYTVRLYFKNEILKELNENSLNIDSKGFFRETVFTIDKSKIEGISARNVRELVNSTDYEIISTLENFTTNQNIVLSWNEKLSGAQTYAYYRYFPIVSEKFYSDNAGIVSTTLDQMLRSLSNAAYLPINSTLNLETDSSIWLPYLGNTFDYTTKVASDYVLSESGLYLVDVYDEAGNHSIEIFMIDTTKPIFALYDGTQFSIPSSSVYITEESTLYWADYKSLYVTNFSSFAFNQISNSNLITEDTLKIPGGSGEFYNFYKTYTGDVSVDIAKAMFDKLYKEKHLQYLTHCTVTSDVANIPSYQGLYLTISIDDLSYYKDGSTNGTYVRQNQNKATISAENEMTYEVLIRDLSNTKREPAPVAKEDLLQYTNHFSAKQTIIISKDSSEMNIYYMLDGEKIYVQAIEGKIELSTTLDEVDDTTLRNAKTTYINPISVNQALTLSFKPTIEDSTTGLSIQVDKVTIKYYPYVTMKVDGEDFYYTTLSSTPTEITVYDRESGPMTTTKEEFIRLNSQNFTTAGKYEISRTYYVGGKYSYNANDYYKRTFVLYVDRNEVISNAELVGSGSKSHLESLIGGDIFVGMYDDGTNADLVVTFPNSPYGNTNGSSLYNNGQNVKAILTTNKLPVYVYVPKMKYTKFVKPVINGQNYYYTVTGEDGVNNYTSDALINEYVLYAEIFKDGRYEFNRIAWTKASLDAVTTTNGFLDFYDISTGNKLEYLKDEGTYYVRIYQGYYSNVSGDARIKNYKEFCFEIKSANPNFVAQLTSGRPLKSEIGTNDIETYYTNQSTINLVWDAGSTYMAEIDREDIYFKTKVGVDSFVEDEIFRMKPTLMNGSWIATIDLEALGIYQNNDYVDITMHFEHDSKLYKHVTKRIYVDLSAPSSNITSLVESSLANNKIPMFNTSSIRTYYTAKMDISTNLNDTSYNISNKTGIFAYYSYLVSTDFLQTLKATTGVDNIYIRQFADNEKYESGLNQETAPSDFLASNFNELTDITELTPGKYYELVEMDKAGNMTIYTIFVAEYAQAEPDKEANNLITLSNGITNVFYSQADFEQSNSYPNSIHNIYAKSGYRIESIDYFGDAWAQLKYSDTAKTSIQYLMLSPWDPGYVYSFSTDSYTKIRISDLLSPESSRFKNALAINNRISRTTDEFFINLRNTTLSSTLTNQQEREFISFSQPTDPEIQHKTYASIYLTYLKITATSKEGISELLFEQTNKLGYATLWQSNTNVIATISGSTITFEVSPNLGFNPNTRIVYEFADNYGTTYKEIHIYRETIITKEVSAKDYNLYSYYDDMGTLIYITQNNFQYSYNDKKYHVKAFNSSGVKVYDPTDGTLVSTFGTASTSNSITTITFSTSETVYYNELYTIEIRDKNNPDNATNFVKSIIFRLYNELPEANIPDLSGVDTNNQPGQFKLQNANGNNITADIIGQYASTDTGYFTEVRVLYSKRENTLLDIKYSVSTDKINWTEIASGTRLRCETTEMQTYYLKVWYDETAIKNEYGTTQFIFGNVPSEQIYEFDLSSLTSTYWVEATINGETRTVEKSNQVYEYNGIQYSNHYIINIPYTEKDCVVVKTNKEQLITGGETPQQVFTDSDSHGIYSELYVLTNRGGAALGNIPAFTTKIVITYIPPTDNISTSLYTYNTNGMLDSSEDLLKLTSKSVVISEQDTAINRIELQWSKYYGMKQNLINISIVKDGIELSPTVYTRSGTTEEYRYTYLTHSGKYTISLADLSGNVQKFNSGTAGQTEKFTLIFLKDVPFTVTYLDITNPVDTETETEGEFTTITTMPIKGAIYNGEVKLNIDKSTRSEFYSASGYPEISVKKDGVKYVDYFREETTPTTSYVFSESGYYEVKFTATSNLQDVGKIRQETYQFTILNPNENKYSFVYNKYSNYYVEKIVKDGEDITQHLVNTLDVATITLNKREFNANTGSYSNVQRTYLVELPLSYMDEKTGAGSYFITINSNNKLYENTTLATSWTFKVNIKVGSAPIRISLAEGKATTSNIDVSFNQQNVYNELGECTIRILQTVEDKSNIYYTLDINSESTGESTTQISATGTFYIQALSPSGTLLFSYKVIKDEPLNAASIIAIIVSVVVVIVIGFIIFKLRKRISVK